MLWFDRSSHQYKSTKDPQLFLRMRLRDLARAHVFYGCQRLNILLRREGWRNNHKRRYRLYTEEDLRMRTKKPRSSATAPQSFFPQVSTPTPSPFSSNAERRATATSGDAPVTAAARRRGQSSSILPKMDWDGLLQVRPFERALASPDGRIGTVVVGRIRDEDFTVSFFEREFCLDTAEVGTDEFGSFARIRESRRILDHGWILEAAMDPPLEEERDTGMGCQISLVKPTLNTQDIDRLGIDTKAVNLLIPPRFAWSIYFGPSGAIDGKGTTGPAPTTKDFPRA